MMVDIQVQGREYGTLVLTDVDVKCFLCGSRHPLITCINTIKVISEFIVIYFESCKRCIKLLDIQPE